MRCSASAVSFLERLLMGRGLESNASSWALVREGEEDKEGIA